MYPKPSCSGGISRANLSSSGGEALKGRHILNHRAAVGYPGLTSHPAIGSQAMKGRCILNHRAAVGYPGLTRHPAMESQALKGRNTLNPSCSGGISRANLSSSGGEALKGRHILNHRAAVGYPGLTSHPAIGSQALKGRHILDPSCSGGISRANPSSSDRIPSPERATYPKPIVQRWDIQG
jgi:hypothetical protein